jgi:predicted SAM-dependent methyltransferase
MLGRGWRFRRGRRRLARHLRGEGLEIGALNEPLRLPRGARVRYVDRLDTAALRERFPTLPPGRLVDVEVVDDGETLATIADGSLDFVVANHVLEHTEDPLAALAAWLRVLRPGGAVFLAIPDMRFTFDRDRSPTTVEHVIADHRHGPARSRRGHYEEWAGRVLWLTDPVADGARLDEAGEEIHFHAWIRESFGALLDAAHAELEVPFEVEALEPNRHEFLVLLRRADD